MRRKQKVFRTSMARIDNQQLLHRTPIETNCGLVTPSIVMNHNIDCHEDIHPILAANISMYISKINPLNAIINYFKIIISKYFRISENKI